MVNLIVNHIVTDLIMNLPFVDKITGIVKTASISVQDKVKTLPIAYNSNISNCSQSELLDYVPNNGQSCIIYFEDRGTTLQKMENQSLYYTSNFTLVCWFDYEQLSGNMTNTSLITGNLIKYLPEIIGNITPLIGVVLTIQGEQANDGAVFTKYSYLEEVSQFITYPYGYVALDLQADYRIRKECVTDITTIADPC